MDFHRSRSRRLRLSKHLLPRPLRKRYRLIRMRPRSPRNPCRRYRRSDLPCRRFRRSGLPRPTRPTRLRSRDPQSRLPANRLIRRKHVPIRRQQTHWLIRRFRPLRPYRRLRRHPALPNLRPRTYRHRHSQSPRRRTRIPQNPPDRLLPLRRLRPNHGHGPILRMPLRLCTRST